MMIFPCRKETSKKHTDQLCGNRKIFKLKNANMPAHIQVLLFDIGGVLFDISSGVQCMLKWMHWSLDEDQLLRKWISSQHVRAYELGKINVDEFAKSIVREFRLPVSENQFIDEYIAWHSGPYDGAIEILESLSKEFITASFSNINELQWSQICESGLTKHMMYNFASCKTGLLKPDIEAFAYVIDQIDCDPFRMIFFDDNQVNVDAANMMRIHGYKTSGFEELRVKPNYLLGRNYI
jgi:putative hydrolase of the HAD superfamily